MVESNTGYCSTNLVVILAMGTNEDIIKETILQHLYSDLGIFEAFKNAMKQHRDAYYSLVMAVWDKKLEKSILFAARDERGIRPLYMASSKDSFYFASESAPIDVLENMGEIFTERGDVTPGSLVVIIDDVMHVEQVLEQNRAHCVFASGQTSGDICDSEKRCNVVLVSFGRFFIFCNLAVFRYPAAMGTQSPKYPDYLPRLFLRQFCRSFLQHVFTIRFGR